MMSNHFSNDATPKAYAKNQVNEVWPIEKFAKHIADHNGVYSRGTVKGVLSDMCECLVEQLLNGNKIQLGELGTFGISISSEPAENLNEFSACLLYTSDAADERASRVVQNAALKAEKNGEANVDIEGIKKK